jgi:LysR family cyn operon transcriptional activator
MALAQHRSRAKGGRSRRLTPFKYKGRDFRNAFTTFDTIVRSEHQNFTRAAEALHVSQPTLSQQIRQLEASLQMLLLDRSGRTVRLTDAGDVFARYARRALQDLDAGRRAIHDVQDLSRGSLRLPATPAFIAYLIDPLVARFNTQYPGISVNIREMTQDRMEAELADDNLDVGMAFPEGRPHEVETQALFVEKLCLVVGKDHLLAERRAVLGVQALEPEPPVLLSNGFATRRHIDDYCQAYNITPNVEIATNSISAVVEIIRGGRLATVLPKAIGRQQCRLHMVALLPIVPTRNAALPWRKGAYHGAAAGQQRNEAPQSVAGGP